MPKNNFTYDISLVSWNSSVWLEKCLNSLLQQTQKPENIFVVDNNSADNSLEILKKFPGVMVFRQNENLGFAKAHNLNIHESKTDFILVVNPDVVLEKNYVEALLDYAAGNASASALVGTVKKYEGGGIDTTGIEIKPWRIAKEIKINFSQPTRVFGVSGAVALFRKKALGEIKIGNEFFNESFFAYKEDIELAWRLNWAGWQAYCVPEAVGRHFRSLSKNTPRKIRGDLGRGLSFRNHLLLYAAVETRGTLLPDLWLILSFEILKLVYLLITDFRVTVKALAEAKKMWHSARTFAKQEKRIIKAVDLRKIFKA